MSKVVKIGEYSEGHLLKTAKGVLTRKTKDSVVLDEEAEARIPKFDFSELQIGRVLGRGGFCVVSEITDITLKESPVPSSNGENGMKNTSKVEDEYNIHNIVQDRGFMAAHCLRQVKDNKKKVGNGSGGGSKGDSKVKKGYNCRYAIKIMQESCRKDANIFVNGVVDLAVEARFLSVVRHPNIIKMRAMCHENPTETSKFFVILDRLYDILSTRISKWRTQDIKGIKKLLDIKKKKAAAFYADRLTVAYDIATALKHLHDLHIVYRDIKPDNIGFDVRGDVKVFDFGLAKEFNPDTKDADGYYNLTADTGSPRYMAPEVYLGKPYNETADVYSFSILLWQILTLETPFEGYGMSTFKKRVFVLEGGSRPSCEKKPQWSDDLINLLRTGWGPAQNRPSMETVTVVLRDEINRNSDEELFDNTLDISGKSAKSLHNENAAAASQQ